MNEMEKIQKNPLIARTICHRLYRLVGLTENEHAPIFGCGTGFFIVAPNQQKYFVFSHHQYKNIYSSKAFALLHSDEFQYNQTKGIVIFDDVKNQDNHIIMSDLDVVLIPITTHDDQEVKYWSNESFWHLKLSTQSISKFFPEVFYGGYPTKTNGECLYEYKIIKKDVNIESSCNWNYEFNKLEIDISSTLDRNGLENLDGMSGGPIFGMKINTESNLTVALLGVITHRSEYPPRIFGTSFLEIFDKLKLPTS